MRFPTRWARRLRRLLRKREVERELDEELRHHVRLEARELERRGLSPADARREAHRRFGGIERTKERVRDERGGRWLEDLFQDLSHAARSLRRDPGFAVVSVLVLALGIAGAVATTSLVHGVLFRPPPFEAPERLVTVWERSSETGGGRRRVPAPDAARVRDAGGPLTDVAFLRVPSEGVVGRGRSARTALIGTVTPNFFGLLGVEAAAGGLAGAGSRAGRTDEGAGGVAPVFLSHGLWTDAFGADPALVGTTIAVNGAPRVVAGVLPASFRLPLPPEAGFSTAIDVWAPIATPLEELRREPGRLVDQDSDNTGVVVGRLAPGATLSAARDRMDALARSLRRSEPEWAAGDRRIEVASLTRDAVAHLRPLLLSLVGAVGLVLLVACLDVATLRLARRARRAPERALKRALGAGRGRLVRQSLAESLLVASVAAVLGVLGAGAAVEAVRAFGPAGLPGIEGAGLGGPAVAVTVAVAFLAVVAAGLTPGPGAGSPEAGVLRSAGSRPGGVRLRRRMVAGQIALSVVLLVGAGLLLRSVLGVQDRDPGFEPRGALTFRVSLRGVERYPGPAERARFVRDMENAVAAVPGVGGVGVVGVLPLGGRGWTQPWGRPGEPVRRWSARTAHFRVATSGYFESAGIELLAGRSFRPEEDVREERRVVVVDAALAGELGGPVRAVGRRVGVPLDGRPVEAEVVGVVETALQESLTEVPLGTIYVPYRQEASRELAVVVRARPGSEPTGFADALGAAVARVDPEVALVDVGTLAGYLDRAVAPLRFAFGVVAAFALLAVLLALVGLYGVVAYAADRRRRELAVRRALGAGPTAVTAAVAGEAARTIATGIALGIAGALLLGPALGGAVVGVAPRDPLVLASAAVVLGAGAAVASLVPAVRAARSDVLSGLRSE